MLASDLHTVIKGDGVYLLLLFINVHAEDGGGVAKHLAHRFAA